MNITKERIAMEWIEVITSVQRRRCWSAEQKQALVPEAEQPGMSISLVARKYGIQPNQLFKWQRLMQKGASIALGANEPVFAVSEVRALRAEILELERLLGKKTMDVEILKEGLRIAREKN
jgi:transposase